MFARWTGLSSKSWSRRVAFHVPLPMIPRRLAQRRGDFWTFRIRTSSVDGLWTFSTTIPRPKSADEPGSKFTREPDFRNYALVVLCILEMVDIIITCMILDCMLNFDPQSVDMLWLFRGQPLNTSTFVPFTVVSKEQISATNFIITVRPRQALETRSYALEVYRQDPGSFDNLFSVQIPFVHLFPSSWIVSFKRHSNVSILQDAWEHGTWSVEIKEPHLQIAREYTPLPPPHDREEDDLDFGHLRFLVRRVDGGEVSSYLSRLEVGDDLELRGPHLGYDVRTRTGAVEASDGHDVVFLAGGTGVAPALQVARAILDGNALKPDDYYRQAIKMEFGQNHLFHLHGEKLDAALERARDRAEVMRASRKTPTVWADAAKPHVTIVWANRQREDCVGCETLQAEFEAAAYAGHAEASIHHKSHIMQQLASLKRRHGDRFTVMCTVDEEGTHIDGSHILQAIGTSNARAEAQATLADSLDGDENSSCVYHSQTATAMTSGYDEAASSHCVCSGGPRAAGKNLLMVSGPEGFVTTLAGSKVWDLGRQWQGPVEGVVGELMRTRPGLFANWLVLKL